MRDDRPSAEYYRLSKQEQANPNSEASHRFQIQRAIEMAGAVFEEAHIYRDIMSGRRTDREDFQRLLEAVRLRRYAAVFVRLDRLSRDAELFHEIERIFSGSRTRLFNISKLRFIDFNDPNDWGDFHREGVKAEEESRIISYRIKLQKEFSRSQNKIQGGRLPLGYLRDRETGRYVIAEDERVKLLRAIDIFFECSCSSVVAVREIEDELGLKYSYQGFVGLLRSPVLREHTPYWGRDTNGMGETRNGSAREPERVVFNTHPAIVSPALAERIDRALEENTKRRGKNRNSQIYALSELLYCDRCDSSCVITSWSGRDKLQRAKIYCAGHRKNSGCGGKIDSFRKGERTKPIGTDYQFALDTVIEALCQRSTQLATVAARDFELESNSSEFIETPEIKQLRQQISQHEKLAQDDLDMLPILQKKRTLLEKALMAIDFGDTESEKLRSELIEFAQEPEFWQQLTPPELKEVLQRFVESIRCDGRSIVVKLRV